MWTYVKKHVYMVSFMVSVVWPLYGTQDDGLLKMIDVKYRASIVVCVGVCVCVVGGHSAVSSSAIPWTIACQAPLSMEFSRQEYWSGMPFSSPGDLPDSGTEPMSLLSPALVGRFLITVLPGKPRTYCYLCSNQLLLHLVSRSKLNVCYMELSNSTILKFSFKQVEYKKT